MPQEADRVGALRGIGVLCCGTFYKDGPRRAKDLYDGESVFLGAQASCGETQKDLSAARISFSGQKRHLKLVLERRDPASVLWENLVKLLKCNGLRRDIGFFRRWSYSTKKRPNVPHVKLEALDPSVGGSDGDGKLRAVPCRMRTAIARVSGEKIKQLRRTKRGVGNEPTPEDGEGFSTSYV